METPTLSLALLVTVITVAGDTSTLVIGGPRRHGKGWPRPSIGLNYRERTDPFIQGYLTDSCVLFSGSLFVGMSMRMRRTVRRPPGRYSLCALHNVSCPREAFHLLSLCLSLLAYLFMYPERPSILLSSGVPSLAGEQLEYHARRTDDA